MFHFKFKYLLVRIVADIKKMYYNNCICLCQVVYSIINKNSITELQ